MSNSFYGFRLRHGILYLYKPNIQGCIPYIDDIVDSVEDICYYCSMHNIRVVYKSNHPIKGAWEFLRVFRLANKYSVYVTWNKLFNVYIKEPLQ